jgi:hypothetical protein
MPKLSCIMRYYRCYMRPVRTEGWFLDANGLKCSRYKVYARDCGAEHILDVLMNAWF